MLTIFESLLPVFLLIGLGQFLKRIRLVEDGIWAGMERISYYTLFPAFLLITMYRADFSSLTLGGLTTAFVLSIAIILGLGLVLKPLIMALTGITGPSYSSVYQGFCRWNAFIALPVTERLYGPEALAIVALAIVAMVVPINFANIMVVTWLGKGGSNKRSFARQIMTNPLIISSLVGIAANVLSLPVYEPVQGTLDLLAKTTLPIGLLLVGAGLKIRLPGASIVAAVISSALKLLVVPAILVVVAYQFGVRGEELMVVAVCGSVPSAMAGYVLARELGGDATLYAAIITLQTVISFFTIPLVLLVTAVFAG